MLTPRQNNLPKINTSGCGNEIDPNVPYWIAFGKALCDKCGAPMLHKRDMGVYVNKGIAVKQVCGEFTRFTPTGKPKKSYSEMK